MSTTGPGQSASLLLDVIGVLQERRIPYAVIGAMAASFHGVVRASLDVDAMISLPPGRTELEALNDALRRAGLKSTVRTGDAGDPIGAVIRVEDRFQNRVDLLTGIRGMTQALFSRAIDAEFMGARIRVVSLEDFIAMKILAGSPKDSSDAAGVLRVSSKQVDVPLLRDLVRPYGRRALRLLETLLRPPTEK